MSISLPNGTMLAAPSSSAAQMSAAVTRILHLTNFSAELKTRDLQAMFVHWENEKGGFRIKWVDDINALAVFADASTAKRAYLSFLLNPPLNFAPPATIRPYDHPNAAHIIETLSARAMGHRSSGSTISTLNGSISLPSDLAIHSRASSMAIPGLGGFTMPTSRIQHQQRSSIAPNHLNRIGHARTGSASSSWGRTSMGGLGGGGGVLNFSMPSKLPTHSESEAWADHRSRSTSSSGEEPVLMLDTNVGHNSAFPTRRDSVSADKAMSEVKKALASVEAR